MMLKWSWCVNLCMAKLWLPAPASPFYLVLRAYMPKSEMLSGNYRLLAMEVLNQ